MVTQTQPSVKSPKVTICGHTHSADAWTRAIARARSEGVRVYRRDSEWYATSVSEPGRIYHVNGRCECKGAQKGLCCKHLAAVLGAQARLGMLARCEWCGRVDLDANMAHPYEHIGGRDDRRATYCKCDGKTEHLRLAA